MEEASKARTARSKAVVACSVAEAEAEVAGFSVAFSESTPGFGTLEG